MSSPGQKQEGCGHVMASFDCRSFCARCHDQGKGKDPCMEKPPQSVSFAMLLLQNSMSTLLLPLKRLKRKNVRLRNLKLPLSVIGAVDDLCTM